ncbi:Chitin binding domain [Trinorchestia longiramus]|nr:Chitin binding domain [Trinorchestia longiramus]KAF2367151.1 Chitin binding domain [Trinorchestia longiramus]
MVCYYGSWAVYRQGMGKFDVEDIDPFLCTHIIYGFAGLGPDNKIKALDAWNDLCDNYGKCAFDRFTGLKNANPNLKALLAIGGWNEGSAKYSAMAANPAARSTFIASVLEMLAAHNFDGLDMDWEYPTDRGGAPEDKANFVILMSELYTALHSKGLMLTAAVSAGKTTIDAAYDVPGFAAAVDQIHVMTYDLHGAWESYTHHHTILYPYPEDTGGNVYLNVDFAINYWIDLGAPRSKLVLGTATYGRCFRLDSTSNTGMYAPASQPGSAGPYTRSPGFLGYNELCEHQLQSAWTVVNDPDMNEPFGYDFSFGNTWCGYDSPESMQTKAAYAQQMGLLGLMVWSIETDDFHAQCSSRPFPLIATLVESFTGEPLTTPSPPPTTTRDPDATTVSTTTESTTTTKPTTFPTAAPGEHCSYPGNNPDPYDCSIFYQCVYTGSGYLETVAHCPEGSLYNPETFICDYDFAVCALDPSYCPANCPL